MACAGETATSKPLFLMMLRHMGRPMWPTPMKPILIGSLPCYRVLLAKARRSGPHCTQRRSNLNRRAVRTCSLRGSACAGSKAKSPPPGGNRGTSRPHLALRGTTRHYVAQDQPLHVVVGGCALSSEGVCILGFRPDLHRVQGAVATWVKTGENRRPRGAQEGNEAACRARAAARAAPPLR